MDNNFRVLLIEDNSDHALLMKAMLGEVKSSRFEIVWVEKLSKGIRELSGGKFDLVLLDLTLPDSCGLDSLKKIYQCNSEVPVVVTTALDNEDLAALAVQEGAQDYLVKGKIDPDLLGRSLVYAMARSRMRKMEEELQKAHQFESLGVLVGGIAHDFNNILTAISGNISLAKIQIIPENKVWKVLNRAEKACDNAEILSKQLLNFSKSGVPLLETASIGGLINEALSFILSGSNISSEFDLPEDLWPVEADLSQINQIIFNLLINAKQAMPGGGEIRITCENLKNEKEALPLPAGRYVKVSIKDQGIGIPLENQENIFNPYFTTKENGSGLGLAISKTIIKKHKGHIALESVSGEGTTFHLYLPASAHAVAETVEREAEIIPAAGNILFMDDDELVQDAGTALLNHLGYDVVTAGNGGEALEIYRRFLEKGAVFDAVIVDLTVSGGMGGKEAVMELLKLDPNAKVIVSSGYANDPVVADFQKYGFSGMITKPYGINKLYKVLHDLPQ